MEALLIVDVQNDFMPGGALPVPNGDEIVPNINTLQSNFELIIATQDWHPSDHGSFAANHPGKNPGEIISLNGVDQILWPVHCVQGSLGADFHSELDQSKWSRIFQKGLNPMVDSYSGFYDNNRQGDTGLKDYLNSNGVKKLYICGLAADYCVKFSVLDALSEGFETILIQDATRAVNLKEGDLESAIAEMKSAGAKLIHSSEI